MTAERLFVALDYPDAASALQTARTLAPLGVGFKLGMQLFYAGGLEILRPLQDLGSLLFVDLKLHDIPNTVAGAVTSLVRHGVTFLNVHTQGGPEMMRAAAEAARKSGKPVKVIGVTMLTSLSHAHLPDFLLVRDKTLPDYVTHLARQAQACGLDGVVCSAREAAVLRQACGPDFLLVTPGIRPAGADVQDQARIVTPAQALRDGADYLVVGRPITGASDIIAATQRILDEMENALSSGVSR